MTGVEGDRFLPQLGLAIYNGVMESWQNKWFIVKSFESVSGAS
jgi:hypothetical protein